MRTRRPTTAALLAVVVVTLSGCWPTPGGGPDRRSANDVEDDLTAANVATLERAFEIDLPVAPEPADLPDDARAALPPKAPVVTGRGLFLSSAEHVHGFDRTTGEERWRTSVVEAQNQGGELVWSTVGPAFVQNDHLGVSSAVARVLDGTTRTSGGAAVIEVETGELVRGAPVPHVPDPPLTRAVTPSIQALRDGEMISYVHPGNRDDTMVAVTPRLDFFAYVEPRHPGLTLGTGTVWVTGRGMAEAYPRRCPGEVCEAPQWRTELDGMVHPVVLDNDATTAFAATTAGELHALDADAGEIRWTVDLGSPAVAPPAHAADDTLYVATEAGEVVAVDGAACDADPASCAPEWRGTTGAGAMTVQPAVGGGVVYTGSADGSVHAFDAAGCDDGPACDARWSDRPFDEPLDGGLAIAFGHLYAGRESGLVAYRPSD